MQFFANPRLQRLGGALLGGVLAGGLIIQFLLLPEHVRDLPGVKRQLEIERILRAPINGE